MHECEWCTNGLNQGLGHGLNESGKSGTEKWLCNDLQNSPTTLNSSQSFFISSNNFNTQNRSPKVGR